MILNPFYFLNQSKERVDRHLMTFKGKKKAPEFSEAKPKAILPFIYKPGAHKQKLIQDLAWSW